MSQRQGQEFYRGKKVLVCGAGISGQAVLERLRGIAGQLALQDMNKSASCPWPEVVTYFGQTPEPEALVAEFDVIVISPGISIHAPFVAKAKSLGKQVVGEFELGAQFYEGEILGITGTNGKTTTTLLTAHLLRQGQEVVVAGNIGVPLVSQQGKTLCVAEVSSFQLETTQHFRPKVSAVLNLTEDHLDRHHTMADYANLKARIFENAEAGDVILLNYDNAYTKAMAEQVPKAATQWFFSTEGVLDIGIYVSHGQVVIAQGAEIQGQFDLSGFKLKGKHNLENALVAVAMAHLCGMDKTAIEKGLSTFTPPEHRLEYVTTKSGVDFYNDSKATNPESAIKSLEAMDAPVVLIAGGKDKQSNYEAFTKAMGDNKVKQAVLIGEIAPLLAEAMAQFVPHIPVIMAMTMEAAVGLAYEGAKAGEVVLLAPASASFDMFRSFEHRGKVFKASVHQL